MAVPRRVRLEASGAGVLSRRRQGRRRVRAAIRQFAHPVKADVEPSVHSGSRLIGRQGVNVRRGLGPVHCGPEHPQLTLSVTPGVTPFYQCNGITPLLHHSEQCNRAV